MKTKAKVLAVLLFSVGVFSNAHADDIQELENIYNSFLPDFQMMTPEASALGQYGKYHSSGFSGVPSISVPLFNISSGNFTMPAELCYDASGIKVDQQATYVGLGWNLIMGGSICQIVCGNNDFYDYSPSPNSELLDSVLPGIGYSPYLSGTFYPSVAFPAAPLPPSTCLPLEQDRQKYRILQDVSSGTRVPDIFQATFCGHSVSFIIANGKAKIIGNDATAYKIDLKNHAASYPLTIEITDDHGIKFVFTAAPRTSMMDNATYNLSEIKNAAGRCLAEFRYSAESCNILQSYYETFGKQDESYNMPIASEAILETFISPRRPGSLLSCIKEYYPDTIITDRETVTFTYGMREDIKDALRINRITVTSNNDNSTVLHTVIFNYGYFSESSYESSLCSRYGYEDVYGYKRLKLTGVTVDEKEYSFGYDENQPLPSRISKQQDFWGYYNGKLNADGLCASPKYQFESGGYLTGVESVGPANRYASEAYCKTGTLNMITYPTGGYTKFSYEINHFNDVDGRYYYPSANSNVWHHREEVRGSGYNGNGYNATPDSTEFDVSQPVQVEISSSSPTIPQYYKLYFTIVGRDSTGTTVFTRYYTKYNDSQEINESCVLPKGHYVMTSQFLIPPSGLMIGGSITVSFPPEYSEDHSVADASGKSIGGGLRIKTIENYDRDDALLGYTHYKYEDGRLLIPTVKEEHIYMLYLYASRPVDPSVNVIPSTLPCAFFFITSNPTYLAVCSLGCPHIGYSKVTREYYDKNDQLMSYDVEKYHNEGYCNAQDKIFSVNRQGLDGKLTESMTYSKDNVPMRKTCYSYETLGASWAPGDAVFFPWARCTDMNPGNSTLDVVYKYSLYSKTPTCALLSSVTEMNYAAGNAMNPVTTAYEYIDSIYQPVCVTRTTSLGSNTVETHQTRYWYPGDAEVSNSGTSFLTGAHCVSERVKAVEYRNGNTAGGYRNVYILQPDSLPVINKNYSITLSEEEVLELDVTRYDSYGNICEYKKKDETPVTLIWSYNHQCPVMEIVGKTYNDVQAISNVVSELEEGTVATEIISRIESLHTALLAQGIMATAYEYSPWYTVSCVIMPNGDKTKYSYDDLGRLEKIYDFNNNTLQKYYYNYGPR
jgi:hypothetical protein